jgi:hypothetical protein
LKKNFRGHGISAMIVNVVAAISPLVIIKLVLLNLQLGNLFLAVTMGLLFIFMFPYPTYLFFELKHVVLFDRATNKPDVLSLLVFGGLSLLGLGLQIATNVQVIGLMGIHSSHLIPVILMSFVASFGGCLGLTDIVCFHGLWLPSLNGHVREVLKSRKLILICLGTTFLLSVLTMMFI